VVTKMKKTKNLARALGILQVFIGLGAVGGGLALVLEPSGAKLGIPLEELRISPFSTYLIPGAVLFLVNGIGSLSGAAASFTRYRHAGEVAMALGAFLMAWIAVQVYWFSSIHWLHAFYFGLGVLEVLLGLSLRQNLRTRAESTT